MANEVYAVKKSLAVKKTPSEKFIWYDTTLDSNALTQRGFSFRNGLMFFHVEYENGVMQTSVDAFIIVSKKLRGWCYFAKILSLPVLKPTINRVYKIFATYQFKKNG